MQNNFEPISGTFSTLGGANYHSEGNLSNPGTSRPVTQKSFAFSKTTARLLSPCLELDMLVEELDLVVEGITNDDSDMETISNDISEIKDIILTRFLVPDIKMNLGSRDNIGGENIVV